MKRSPQRGEHAAGPHEERNFKVGIAIEPGINPHGSLDGEGRVERAARVRFGRDFGCAQRRYGVAKVSQVQPAPAHHPFKQRLAVERRQSVLAACGHEQQDALLHQRFNIVVERVADFRQKAPTLHDATQAGGALQCAAAAMSSFTVWIFTK